MSDLIRSDFKRVLKDKLTLVLCIIGAGFSLLTTLMTRGLLGLIEVDMPDGESLIGLVTAKSQFFGAFSVGNNFGIIVPILFAIVICKDFSQGTIRNKIIGGHKRSNIFLSSFIVSAVSMFIIVLLHALLTLFISLIFFDYQEAPFVIGDLWYLLLSLLLEMAVYMFIGALISWMCASFKNVGVVIVIYFALSFVMTLIAGIISGVTQFILPNGENDTLLDVLNFVQRINIFYSSSSIGIGSSYTFSDVLYILLPALFGTAVTVGWGIFRFSKKDLK